jgi:hypothetical protein
MLPQHALAALSKATFLSSASLSLTETRSTHLEFHHGHRKFFDSSQLADLLGLAVRGGVLLTPVYCGAL